MRFSFFLIFLLHLPAIASANKLDVYSKINSTKKELRHRKKQIDNLSTKLIQVNNEYKKNNKKIKSYQKLSNLYSSELKELRIYSKKLNTQMQNESKNINLLINLFFNQKAQSSCGSKDCFSDNYLNAALSNIIKNYQYMSKEYDEVLVNIGISKASNKDVLNSIKQLNNAKKKYKDKLAEIKRKISDLSNKSNNQKQLLFAMEDRVNVSVRNKVVKPTFSLNGVAANFKKPVIGSVVSGFGSPRSGGLKWKGVTFKVEKDAVIRSIANGRVAYIGKDDNLGNLLIIDHGKGDMSLYGYFNNNRGLKVGDKVNKNSVLGFPSSDSRSKSSKVYFELRRNNVAVNPFHKNK